MTRQLRIRLHSLAFLWALLAVLIPPLTFAYDGQTQTNVSYDDSGKAESGYDAISVLATGENKYEASGDCIFFAKFAGFLAAKGGTTPLWRAVKPEELADIQAQVRLLRKNGLLLREFLL